MEKAATKISKIFVIEFFFDFISFFHAIGLFFFGCFLQSLLLLLYRNSKALKWRLEEGEEGMEIVKKIK